MYELAAEDEQTYKEGKVILEKALVRERDGLPEMEVVEWIRNYFFIYKYNSWNNILTST